ncbi:MAG: nicotinate (nicotinamide) nucleotide adenylyltransferase [Phycisphaerales bacterium]|nr:nicotinate (nicotinamide) nucleotide adenylyltransferase [Planctomycetota bacterium]MBL6997349.1 nicotinate (nicotinamide) nucleotide adenylyltransferase [Phycisphaerales bacterium]
MTRTLLYGGSFDPPHIAHVEIPRDAMNFLQFDHILYVPASRSPLKDNMPTSNHHRLEMLKLALADCPWASISTIELDRKGTSYTIETIEAIKDEYDELRLLIGADQWEQFNKWRRWEDVIKLANPAIMPRDNLEVSDERVLPIQPITAGSTDIRRLIQDGKSIEELVLPTVAQYIAEHQLYL